MSTPTLARVATAFKALHIPGTPLVLANVYDAASARVVAALPECKALATASYAVALAAGTRDPDLTLKQHLALLAPIAAVAREANKPLTVDLQSGYSGQLDEAISGVIDPPIGAVGINLEDSAHESGKLMDVDVAVGRIQRALEVAREKGVPDFVVNARSDALFVGGTLEESIARGKRYLQAGATAVYILWPPGKQMEEERVKVVIQELDGKVNLAPRFLTPAGEEIKGGLTTPDLARLGVARVSVGPQLYFAAAKAWKSAAAVAFGK